MFSGRGRRMPMNNLRQATRPVGCRVHRADARHRAGTGVPAARGPVADGATSTKVIYAVPGVPWEMKEMVLGTILPDLQRRAGITSVIASRTLRTWGESESGLAETLVGQDRRARPVGNPTLAFLASGMEGLKVRDHRQGRRPSRRWSRSWPPRRRLVRACWDRSCSASTTTRWSPSCWTLLGQRGLSLGVAESLTGGMIGSRLCDVPGAVEGLPRAASCRTRSEVKSLGCSGFPRARWSPRRPPWPWRVGARTVLGTDVGIAATGVAGPDPQEDQPPGHGLPGRGHRRSRRRRLGGLDAGAPPRAASPGP